MRQAKRFYRSTKRRFQERGSALLVSLMVMVGLSLLGLGFVALSETESAISINERNHAQTVALAEAGARQIVECFQNPQQANTLQLLPNNIPELKTERNVDGVVGYYKPTGELFDTPYTPLFKDMFYGEEASADVVITRGTPQGITALNRFNSSFLGPEPTGLPRHAGEITEIRVYAPPIVGGSLIDPPGAPVARFWSGGTRYGVATIMVRAEKFDKPITDASRRSIAQAECRVVVSEFPLPTPAGPLQSQTALVTNGNFNVHWGLVSAQTDLNLNKDYGAFPWFNAYERAHFQRGYDSSIEWSANAVYTIGTVVRPTIARLSANPALRAHEYLVIATSGGGSTGPTEPPATGAGAWPTTDGATLVVNEVTFKERAPSAYPIDNSNTPQTNTPWLYWLGRGNVNIEDPWFQVRAAGQIIGGGTGPQRATFPYATPGTSIAADTHQFQFQSFDSFPFYRRVVFPIIDYNFWKATAIASNGNGQVHYLQWVADDTYTDGITTQAFENWVARNEGGFYFFETQNRQNPQGTGGGVLAPSVDAQGGTQYYAGFIYLNAPFGTQGLKGITGNFTQPGEPYMDIGYRQVAEATGGGIQAGSFIADASGAPTLIGAFNRNWDFQDLAWSNTNTSGPAGTKNTRFDVFIEQRTVTDPSGASPTSYNGWFVAPYYPGCKPGNNEECATCNCSEPHEPYMNIKYEGGSSLLDLEMGWYAPTTAVTTMRKPKKTTNGLRTGTLVTCASRSPAITSLDDCTSNAYDLDGAAVTLTVATDGVLYTEGEFDSTGNAEYYGSVLVGQGGVNPKGTPVIWYDEKLQRGDWRPPGIPRVLITSIQTDQ